MAHFSAVSVALLLVLTSSTIAALEDLENGLPSSCADLKSIGHTLNGFYFVMGSAKLESVYCDFTKLPDDAGFQKGVGYVNVKLAPVEFSVLRHSLLSTTAKTPIPFELALKNEGNAMNLTSGKFTAPQTGIYSFFFMKLWRDQSVTSIYSALYLNGNVIESSDSKPANVELKKKLEKGDQVWLQLGKVGLPMDDYSDYSHRFEGSLLNEEIAASL